MPLSLAKASGSSKTRAAVAARSSVGPASPGTTRSSPSSRAMAASTSGSSVAWRARTSASTTAAPRAASILATVDLPAPMLPVSPTRTGRRPSLMAAFSPGGRRYAGAMLRTRRPARLREPDPTAFAPWPAAGVLVGGAVRDALLGREPSDLDWLVPDPRAACEAAARELGGSCFPLDETRGHWRAVAPGGGVTHDFAPLRGEVEDDLTRRDLTVNALALAASGGVLDPTGGLDDLREGRVRMTSEAALRADPVRPLRAVRFVA